jgi:Response regulator containing a CheY-like receiver domain and an HTH DNA-binding domain
MSKIIKIIAVDDNPEFLESLKAEFALHKDQYRLIACISTMAEKDNEDYLIEKIGRELPDVILMDFSFRLVGRPSDFGIYLVKLILKRYPNQKIIMLTHELAVKGTEIGDKVRRSFRAGAEGYIRKDQPSSWRGAIAEVVKGELYLSRKTFDHILKEMKKAQSQKIRITKRETEVLNHLIDDKTLLEISALLSTTINGINFHIRNLKTKYDCNTLHGLVSKHLSWKIL